MPPRWRVNYVFQCIKRKFYCCNLSLFGIKKPSPPSCVGQNQNEITFLDSVSNSLARTEVHNHCTHTKLIYHKELFFFQVSCFCYMDDFFLPCHCSFITEPVTLITYTFYKSILPWITSQWVPNYEIFTAAKCQGTDVRSLCFSQTVTQRND